MGVSLETWRARIGCFCTRRPKTIAKWKAPVLLKPKWMGITFKLVLFVLSLIIIAGDVERNPGPNQSREYSHKTESFNTQEVLDILQNPDWDRVISEPPAKPRAGQVFLYHFTEDAKKDDWRCDQYHFHHDATRKQPKSHPKFSKLFFVIRTSHGKDSRFKKHAYILLEGTTNLVLFQYLGDERVAQDLPHGNSKDKSSVYTRLCPSVIKRMKTDIPACEILNAFQGRASTSVEPTVHQPRSLNHVWNTKSRVKYEMKIKKRKTGKKKPKINDKDSHDSETLKSLDHDEKKDKANENVNQNDDAEQCEENELPSHVTEMSGQQKLINYDEIHEECSDISFGQEASGIESAPISSGMSESGPSSEEYHAEVHGNTNTQACCSKHTENRDSVHETAGTKSQEKSLPWKPQYRDTHVEMLPISSQCILQNGNVSSSHRSETEDHTTNVDGIGMNSPPSMSLCSVTSGTPNTESTIAATEHQGEATYVSVEGNTSNNFICLQQFLNGVEQSGQLSQIVALLTRCVQEQQVDVTNTMSMVEDCFSVTNEGRCVTNNTRPTIPCSQGYPHAASSLIKECKALWTDEFSKTRNLLIESNSAQMSNRGLLDLMTAVILGTYMTGSDPVHFADTLNERPGHLRQEEGNVIKVDSDGKYKIGRYIICGKDLQRLEGSVWLDDSMIHAFLNLMQMQYAEEYKRKIFIIECFLEQRWAKGSYSDWLYEKEQLTVMDWIFMPVCRYHHWILIAANVRDRTVCVINSKPSPSVQAEMVTHWRKYMKQRSKMTDEDMSVWREIQCPVFPQTDGSGCGVYVLMAAEALLCGVPPAIMRSCHVTGYRKYVKQRLLLASEAKLQAENCGSIDSMEADTDIVTLDAVNVASSVEIRDDCEDKPGSSPLEDRSPVSCEMETACEVDNISPNFPKRSCSLSGVPAPTPQVSSVLLCAAQNDQLEDMEVHNYLNMSIAKDLDINHIRSKVDFLFHKSKQEFAALVVLCMKCGELDFTFDNDSDSILKTHVQWACDVAGINMISIEELKNCFHTLDRKLVKATNNGVTCVDTHTTLALNDVLTNYANQVLDKMDMKFIHKYVRLDSNTTHNISRFIIRVQKETQKQLVARFVEEVIQDNFAHVLTHRACEHYCFAVLLISSIEKKCANLQSLMEREDREYGGSFIHWVCSGKNAEFYKCVRSYVTSKSKCECIISSCMSGNDEVLSVLLAELDIDIACGITPKYKDLPFLNSESNPVLCTTNMLPPLHLACYYGHVNVVSSLLQAGFDIDKQLPILYYKSLVLPRGPTPAAVAAERGHTEVMNRLIKDNCDLTLVDTDYNTPLHIACREGHSQIVSLLTRHCSPSGRNKDGNTPLHLACIFRNQKIVEILLHNNADISLLNFNNHSPLDIACEKGYTDIVQTMLDSSEYPLPYDSSNTPLHKACTGGFTDIVPILLRNGAGRSVNLDMHHPLLTAFQQNQIEIIKLLLSLDSTTICFVNPGKFKKKGIFNWSELDRLFLNNERYSPLSRACKRGDVEIVKLLLEKGADVSVMDDHGYTPLEGSCDSGNVEIVKLLLENGADVSVWEDEGYSPLSTACKRGDVEIVKLLLEKGADVSVRDDDGYTPLERSCDSGNVEIVKLLLENGADVSVWEDEGYSPLSTACKRGDVEIVKLLLEKGADVSVGGDDGYTPLERACDSGNVEIVKLLLEKGADVSFGEDDGYSPLSRVCKRGFVEIVKLFLENGANVSVGDNDGYTPLERACDSGNVEIVKLLLENGADASFGDDDGYTLLERACDSGNVEIVKLLLENGANVSVRYDEGYTLLELACDSENVEIVKLLLENGADASFGDDNEYPLLERACDSGNVEIVKLLLENGADASFGEDDGLSPVATACKRGDVEIVKLLLENGADASFGDDDGYTLLERACDSGNVEIVKLLLENGADVSVWEDEGCSPLSKAWKREDVEIVKLLLEKGADVSVRDEEGYTPLERACDSGNVEIVKLLLKKGADVSVRDDEGYSPLSTACKRGDVEIVKLLLEKGAEVSYGDNDGYTPLERACDSGNVEIVKLLLENGADVSFGEDDGYSPLSRACKRGDVEIVTLLLENGADVSVRDDQGYTPLEGACDSGNVEIVKLLLENGADVSVRDDEGYSPLSTACKRGDVEIVKLLLEKGAEVSYGDNERYSPLSRACKRGDVEIVTLLLENGADVSVRDDQGYTPLEGACDSGNVELVKLLLKNGADVSVWEDEGYSPLSRACKRGDVEIVTLLLENGADVSVRDDQGYTPLEGACDSGNVEIVKLLLEKGADVSVRGDEGYTLLETACDSGNVEIVKLLLENGADVSVWDGDRYGPLPRACKRGDVEIVTLLLEKGAEVSYGDNDGYTPLERACDSGNVEIVKLLLENGADVSFGEDDGYSPLSRACKRGDVEIVTLLLENGADVSVRDDQGYTPLEGACDSGNVEIVKLLLEKGADVSVRDDEGYSPLSTACKRGDVEIVKLLLEKGAEVSYGDNERYSPLSRACKRGDVEIVTLLLENGADVSVRDDQGYTPLEGACDSGNVELVKLLLKNGADVSVWEDEGYSPLSTACKRGDVEIVTLLLENGADVSVRDDQGYTPLEGACDSGNVEIVKLLLEKGADVSVRDDEGYTPLETACDSGNVEIVKLLLENGADVSVWDGDRYGPLPRACKRGDVEIVKLLLEKGADMSVEDDEGFTPLGRAYEGQVIDLVRLLVQKGVTVMDNGGYTQLGRACEGGNIDIVKLLLEKGANMSVPSCNQRNLLNQTQSPGKGFSLTVTKFDSKKPIVLACKKGHVNIVNLLMNSGSEIEEKYAYGYPPVLVAFLLAKINNLKDLNSISILINPVVDGESNCWIQKYKQSPVPKLFCFLSVQYSVRVGHVDVVKQLLDKCPGAVGSRWDTTASLLTEIDVRLAESIKLLLYNPSKEPRRYMEQGKVLDSMFSIVTSQLVSSHNQRKYQPIYAELLKLLLENGREVSHVLSYSRLTTLLTYFSKHGNVSVIITLLEQHTDVSFLHELRYLSLYHACYSGHENVVRYLLEKDIDFTKNGIDGLTPLGVAQANGYIEIAQLLILKGFRLYGRTSLLTLIGKDNLDCIQFILEKGVNFETADSVPSFVHFLFSLGMSTREIHIFSLIVQKADVSMFRELNITHLLCSAMKNSQMVLCELLSKISHSQDVSVRSEMCHMCVNCLPMFDTLLTDITVLSEDVIHAVNKPNAALIDIIVTKVSDQLHEASFTKLLRLISELGDKILIEKLLQRQFMNQWFDMFSVELLYKACMYQHVDIVKLLIEKSANTCFIYEGHKTLLHVTCKTDNERLVKILLRTGIYTDLRDIYGETALYKACKYSNVKVLTVLLEKGACVNILNCNRNSPLLMACTKGFIEIASRLLKSGANVNQANHVNITPLHAACDIRCIEIIRSLLNNGADIQSADNGYQTVLHKACKFGSDDVVKLLLQNNADPFRKDKRGRYPVSFLQHNRVRFQVLCTFTTNNTLFTSDDSGNNLLHYACRYQFVSCAVSLLKRGICSSQVNDKGESPMYVAVENQNIDLVRGLVQSGCELSCPDLDGNHPIHIACADGSTEIVQLLLDHERQISSLKGKDGFTSLHYAIKSDHLDIAELLLKAGADVNEIDSQKNMPLHLASERGNTKLVQLLLKHNADINATGLKGHTPLHRACVRGHIDVVRLLLDSKADSVMTNYHNNTPLYAACLGEHIDVVKFLLERADEQQYAGPNGYPCVVIAASRGLLDLLNLMVEHGAHVSPSTVNVSLLSRQSDINCVYKLLADEDEGILSSEDYENVSNDVQKDHIDNLVPVHLAYDGKHRDVFNCLVKSGADLSDCDENGETVFSKSFRDLDMDAITILLQNNFKPDLSKVDLKYFYRILKKLHVNKYLDMITILYQSWKDLLKEDIISEEKAKMFSPEKNALFKQDYELLSFLLDANTSDVEKDEIRNSLLETACLGGRRRAIQWVLQKWPKCLSLSQQSLKLINLLPRTGHRDLKYLLSNHFTMILLEKEKTDLPDYDTAIEIAYKHGLVRFMNILIIHKQGIHIAYDKYKESPPLHVVYQVHGHNVLKDIVKAGIDISEQDVYGYTILHTACELRDVEAVHILLTSGDKSVVFSDIGEAPIHIVCRKGFTELIAIFLDKGVNMETKTVGKLNNCLHVACFYKKANVAAMLLSTHTELWKEKNSDGQTPIEIAANRQCHAVLKAFVDANVADCLTGYYLDFDGQLNDIHLIKLLIKVGTDFLQRDSRGNTLFHVIVERGNCKIVNILLCARHKRPSVSMYTLMYAPNHDGQYPLHIAVLTGNVSMTKLLLEFEADPDVENDTDATPLHIASSKDHIDIVQILLEAGAAPNETDMHGNTPLHCAVINGFEKVVSGLLAHDAGCNIKNLEGRTPLHESARMGFLNITHTLVSSGACLSVQDNELDTPMLKACAYGHTNVVNYMVGVGADLNIPNQFGDTPLHIAAVDGDTKMLSILLNCQRHSVAERFVESGADPNVVNDKDSTPLHVSSLAGHTNVVQILLESGADPNMSDINGNSPLHNALHNGHEDVCSALLSYDAICNIQNSEGRTPLHESAAMGFAPLSHILVRSGACISVQDDELDTPLHKACYHGHQDVVEDLLDAGSDSNIPNKYGNTPMHLAIVGGHIEVIAKLLNRKTFLLTNLQGQSALHLACQNNKNDILELILKELRRKDPVNIHLSSTISLRDFINGSTALHLASFTGDVKTVTLLKTYGADTTVKDNEGNTPVFVACKAGHVDIVRELLYCDTTSVNRDRASLLHVACRLGDEGMVRIVLGICSVNVRDKYGRTPLFDAVENGHMSIASLLINLGAKVNVSNIYQRSPLHDACWEGRVDCVRLLIASGSNLDVQNHYGNTPLHNACMERHDEVVVALLEHGCHPSPVNMQDMTPLHYACLHGNQQMAQLLMTKGADTETENSAGNTPADLCSSQPLKDTLANFKLCPTSRKRRAISNRYLPPKKRRMTKNVQANTAHPCEDVRHANLSRMLLAGCIMPLHLI